MLRKPRLFTAGPTPVHPEASRALVGPQPYHRSAEFSACFERVQAGLRGAFRTAGPVAVIAASGTGGMEAAVANLFGPDDRVAVIEGGKFGERWTQLAAAYSIPATRMVLAPGEALAPAAVAEHIASHQPLSGVLFSASETSTATAFDVEGIARAARQVSPDIVLAVDAITAVGALPIETDAWGIDAVVGGSQKGLMIPPGLAFVACSPRGWERVGKERPTPRYYFDLRRYAETAGKSQTPFTPAIGLVQALDAALAALEEAGGISALEENAERLAAATRSAAAALDLELLSKATPSPAVTAVRAPEPGSAPEIVARLRDGYAAQVSGGQGALKPDIFRIGHIGYVDDIDLLGLLGVLEPVLQGMGHPVQLGAGVAAASASLQEDRRAGRSGSE
jgi:aspartate aminotransferase-like enzyme